MSKITYFTHKVNNESYGILIGNNVSEEDSNACLDAMDYENIQFITEEEFRGKYKETMFIDIFDPTDSYKIGVLETNKISLQEGDSIYSKNKSVSPVDEVD